MEKVRFLPVTIVRLSVLVVFLVGTFACRKGGRGSRLPVEPAPPIEQTPTALCTAIDQWILDSLTKPYGVEVIYHFDASLNGEGSEYAALVPPKEEKIIPVLRVFKRVLIDVYERVGGRDFIRKILPKKIVLVGSSRYNPDGTVTEGFTQGSKKMLLFRVNDFDPAQKPHSLVKFIHLVEHEFGHVLHQAVPFSKDFEQVSDGSYTANWAEVHVPLNYEKGFVTPYAMSNEYEDFAETLAHMLVNGQEEIKNRFFLLGGGVEPVYSSSLLWTGWALFDKKVDLMRQYFRDTWNIDFDVLCQETRGAIYSVKRQIERAAMAAGVS